MFSIAIFTLLLTLLVGQRLSSPRLPEGKFLQLHRKNSAAPRPGALWRCQTTGLWFDGGAAASAALGGWRKAKTWTAAS